MDAGRVSVMTNISLNCMNRMYEKPRPVPAARFHPMPPRFFFVQRDRPMMVRIKADMGSEKRLCFSIRLMFTEASPRMCCVRMSWFSSYTQSHGHMTGQSESELNSEIVDFAGTIEKTLESAGAKVKVVSFATAVW